MEIAVAIPTYNRADLLPATLESLYAQTLQPTEIFICDDGSSDATTALLAQLDGRVRWCRIVNQGPAMARACAIESTRAGWIALCDSDDLWRPDHLERLAALARRWPEAGLLFSNFVQFGAGVSHPAQDKFQNAPPGWWQAMTVEAEDDFRWLGLAPYAGFLSFQPIFPSCVMFRRALYEEVGGTLAAVSRLRSEDAHLTRRLLAVAGVACDAQSTTFIRRHAGNFSLDDRLNDEGRLRILRLLLEEPVIQHRFFNETSQEISRSTRELFLASFHARDFAAAARLAADTPELALGWRRFAVWCWARYRELCRE